LDADFAKGVVLVACVTVLVALLVVGGQLRLAPPGEEQIREEIPSFCEQLRETDLNPIQKCRPGDSTQTKTVRL
jgi:hypothetical protein